MGCYGISVNMDVIMQPTVLSHPDLLVGGHDSVIQYFITCGAHLTDHIVDQFARTLSQVFWQYVEAISSETDQDRISESRV